MPHAEGEMPLAGTPPFYEVTSEHNQRTTARARNRLACCTSSPETESAGAPALSDTRRWLGVEGRSWHVAQRARVEGARLLADVAAFYGVSDDHNRRGTARASDELKCCASSLETVRRVTHGA